MNHETLTHRERVIRAIRHQPVDRMPIDLGMHYSTGISAFAYWNLREHLGLSTDSIDVPDMVQFLARVDTDILERFHCDCMLLQPRWSKSNRWNPRGHYNFSIPCTAEPKFNAEGEWIVERNGKSMRMPAGGFFFDGDWPDFNEETGNAFIAQAAREAERIYKETDYATMLMAFGGYFSSHIDSLCKMLTDPDEIHALNEKMCQEDLLKAELIIKSMGKYIQGICLNSDLGSQSGPFCRPSVYAELCAPYVKRLCKFIHENSDCKVFLHCCGSVKPMIPILIDSGIDILNPVQISAKNMNPQQLKQEFGDDLTFWGGGCNTQEVLWSGTPAQVDAHVRELVNVFKPRAGFVFNQVHNIMGDVPPQNIVAMFDAAYAESFYEAGVQVAT